MLHKRSLFYAGAKKSFVTYIMRVAKGKSGRESPPIHLLLFSLRERLRYLFSLAISRIPYRAIARRSQLIQIAFEGTPGPTEKYVEECNEERTKVTP